MSYNIHITLRHLACFLLLLTVVSASRAQETAITHQDFNAYFKRSQIAVGEVPFRVRTVIEMAESRDGPWDPYSSWTVEVVPPDTSHITYTSGRQGDFIQIGKRSFSRSSDGIWTETKDVINWSMFSTSLVRSISGPDITYTESRSGDKTIVTVISKRSPGAAISDTGTRVYIYQFDDRGRLIAKRSTLHNSLKWADRAETFEYDPDIRIERPIE